MFRVSKLPMYELVGLLKSIRCKLQSLLAVSVTAPRNKVLLVILTVNFRY